MIQRGPNFGLSAHYIKETNTVEVRWEVSFLPPMILGLTPESYLDFCNQVIGLFGPFNIELKRQIGAGKMEDIKVEFDYDKWNRLMED